MTLFWTSIKGVKATLALVAGIILGAVGVLLATSTTAASWTLGFPGRASTKVQIAISTLERNVEAVPLPTYLVAAEARRNGSVPYLFDVAAQPNLDEACGRCTNKATVPDQARNAELLKAPQVLSCCGVCQYEGRHCSLMAAPGAMAVHIQEYRDNQGIDFSSFSPAELFARLKGRTFWLLGDSQTWHWFYAFECFMRRYAAKPDRQVATVDPQAYQQLSIVHFPVVVPPTCVDLLSDTRICAVRVDAGIDMITKTLPTLERLRGTAFPDDIIVANFGLHFGGNSRQPFQAQLRALANYTTAHAANFPSFIWRTTSVQHFATPRGEYDPAELGRQCRPLTAFYEGDPVAASGGPLNMAAAEVTSKAGWPVLNTYNATVPLWDVHKTGECTHYCSPSAYHVWVWLFNELLRERNIGNVIPAQQSFPQI